MKLANDIKDVLARSSQEDRPPEQIITSSLIALCIELGRLRFLAISSGDVSEDNFDQITWEIIMDNYKENLKKYGVFN